MYKYIPLIFALALSACTTTRDGIRIGGGAGPAESDMVKVRNQLSQNAQSSAAKAVVTDALNGQVRMGVIVVGETGVFRKIDEDKKHEYYVEYRKLADKWHPGQPTLVSEADFSNLIGGWTTMETFSIPGIVAVKLPAAIRQEDIIKFTYPSTVGSWLISATGDLVAAHSNPDGILVIEKVLCKDNDKEYRTCAGKYARGRYDINTGEELDRAMKVKAGGTRIDPSTYLKQSS